MPIFLRIFAVLTISLLPLSAAANSKKPIRLVEGTTVEQRISSTIASKALTKAGFKFELVPIADGEAIAAVVDGSVHAHLAMPNSDALSNAIETKEVRSLGGLANNARKAPVLKIVSSGMKKKWPDAQKMFKRMILTPELLGGLVSVASSGATIDDVVSVWWKENSKVWNPWIAASKNWMKP